MMEILVLNPGLGQKRPAFQGDIASFQYIAKAGKCW